jgi:hypothetical protein
MHQELQSHSSSLSNRTVTFLHNMLIHCRTLDSDDIIWGVPVPDLLLPCHAEVPAGYIMNRGVVTPCPKGTFREGVALPTAQLQCTRCNRGWTTGAVASTLASHCNRTLPGFQAGGANQLAANTEPCPVGSWAGERPGNDNGGVCLPCGSGWTTKNLTLDTDGQLIGATSQSACGESIFRPAAFFLAFGPAA